MSHKYFTIHNTKKSLEDTLRLENLLKISKLNLEDLSLTGSRRLENPSKDEILEEIYNRIESSEFNFFIPYKYARKEWTNQELAKVEKEIKPLICLVPRCMVQRDIPKYARKLCKQMTAWNTISIEREICKKISFTDSEEEKYCKSIAKKKKF